MAGPVADQPGRRHPQEDSPLPFIKRERRQAASKPVAFNASPRLVGNVSSIYVANGECPHSPMRSAGYASSDRPINLASFLASPA